MSTGISQRTRRRILGVASVAAVVLLWQLVADLVVRSPFILPSFTDVASAFFRLIESGVIFTDLVTSLMHFGIGLGAGLLIGVPIGIVMGWFWEGDAIADPIIEIVRPIPPLAWIPFAIVWFGLTPQAAGFVIFVGTVFPIIIITYAGFRSVPKVFVEAGKVLGCTRSRDLIRYIALPAALPSIASGIRIAMGVGWMCLVAAEMFGVSSYGLGHKIWWYYYLHQMPNVVVYMLVLGLIGLAIDRLFRYYMDRTLLKWQTGVVA